MNVLKRADFFQLIGSGTFEGEHPHYTGADVEPLIAFSRCFQPKTVIEIGIQRGATAKIILENSPWIEKYIGIDVDPSYTTALSIQQEEVPQTAGECVKDDPRVELIIRPNGTRDLTPADLPAADLIFIDGDHSMDGVLYDTQLARQVIRKGGIICWHDYGNPLVPSVTVTIDYLNLIEGEQISLIENGFLCFQICKDGR